MHIYINYISIYTFTDNIYKDIGRLHILRFFIHYCLYFELLNYCILLYICPSDLFDFKFKSLHILSTT